MTTHSERLRRQQAHYRLLDRLDNLARIPVLWWLWRLFWFAVGAMGIAALDDMRWITWGLLTIIVITLLIIRETIIGLVKGWRDE